MGERASRTRQAAAWGVHLLTASGVLWCLLAIEASIRENWRAAFAWLTLTVIVDAIDGTLARRVGVKSVLPSFDGALLDNVVDYVSYVVVPAFFLHWASLLPQSWSFFGAAAICIASAYQFCQSDAKTPDHYFKGFPSYWNITVFYLLAAGLPRVVNLAVVGVLVALVFVPLKYVYPSRTPHWRRWTLTLTCAWGVAAFAILWQFPTPNPWLVWGSTVYFLYYFGLSLYLNLRPGLAVP